MSSFLISYTMAVRMRYFLLIYLDQFPVVPALVPRKSIFRGMANMKMEWIKKNIALNWKYCLKNYLYVLIYYMSENGRIYFIRLFKKKHTNSHTHIYIYIYIYMCVWNHCSFVYLCSINIFRWKMFSIIQYIIRYLCVRKTIRRFV